MKLTQDKTGFRPALFWNLLIILFSYRLQMPITEVMVFPDGNGYYVCPRCHITVEREFMSFCDRCGQHLGWKGYKKARKIYPGQHNSVHTWCAEVRSLHLQLFMFHLNLTIFIHRSVGIALEHVLDKPHSVLCGLSAAEWPYDGIIARFVVRFIGFALDFWEFQYSFSM